jgi:methylated-DNA-[protein]-cysteine S-methyltransferase
MSPASDPTTRRLLEGLAGRDDDALARLHGRLVAAAQRDGVLDIAYRTLDTPVGTLLLASTEQGLIRVAYQVQDHDAVLAYLATVVSPRVLKAPARLDEVSRQLEEYFARRRTVFEVPLDLRLSTGFRRVVLSHLPEIAYGSTESYSRVAAAAGSPRAVRAVGTACATNPLPVVVPCHRVVPADGSLGGYVGGPQAKQTLLTLETARR